MQIAFCFYFSNKYDKIIKDEVSATSVCLSVESVLELL